ncbi:N-acetylmuramoyl-L-alanine amidase [Clostridium butyricum]|uniref:N-acetylmuramoyl-L-alanine amidase n=1 Tax=Clostridium butyricum TaxID=1492 RepID=UPI0018A886BE|nr:N-acetylmuramoyl-L-alanine amidase [Clostridium butyricum]
MSNFVIAAGHTASGNIGCGVVAYLDESKCTREISQLVGKELERKGHKVNFLIIDKSNSYNYEDCYVRAEEVNKLAKNSKIDLYAEIHINAGRGTGTEVCITGKSSVANQYATKICSVLSAALNIPNRGVKTQSLIVLNKTSMPVILIECLFADSSDSRKYDSEVIARSIADGLVGAESGSSNSWKLGWNRNDIGLWYSTDSINKYYYTSQNGWKCIEGQWYIFDEQGYALESAWYYDKNEGHWYYLDEEGRMYSDCVTSDGWRVDESGMWRNNF